MFKPNNLITIKSIVFEKKIPTSRVSCLNEQNCINDKSYIFEVKQKTC